MKTHLLKVMAMSFAALISAAIAQSNFSGIYQGSVKSGPKFTLALTKGGRALGLYSNSKGLKDALDPAKSTINSSGRLKGATPSGSIVTANVSTDFKISGTVKSDDGTFRITGKRTFK